MKDVTTISIIIPNWNGIELLRKFLPEVVSTSQDAEIIVVDDNSNDNSVLYIKENYPNIKVINGMKRSGFSTNVNRGVRYATGEIVVLLNTDIKPVNGYLTNLARYFSDPKVFAVGCMEKSHEGENIILRGRGTAKWENGFFIHARGEVDRADTVWVSGGSGAFRKSLWVKLGGLSEMYNPFYWEDIDLSYRALKAGYAIVFAKECIVHHYHNMGKIKTKYTQFTIRRISYRNQFIFIWSNITSVSLLLSHILGIFTRLLRCLLKGDIWFLFGLISAIYKIFDVMEARKTRLQEKFSDKEVLLPFRNE